MDVIEKINNQSIAGWRTFRQRIVYENAVYHITQRAPGREIIFVEDGDYFYFLKILKQTTHKFSLDIFSFALMPNHIHLLLRIKEKNLSSAMKNLFEKYALFFNKKYQRKGHVFCGRFRASLCNDSGYLMAVSIYIHLNPFKAGLSKNLEDYRWTSLDLYTKGSIVSFVDPTPVLSILCSDLNEARKVYHKILMERMSIQENTSFNKQDVKRSIIDIGSSLEEFINKNIIKEIGDLVEKFDNCRLGRSISAKKIKKYVIQQLAANGYQPSQIIKKLCISRYTYYRLL